MADDVVAGRYRLLEQLGRGAMSAVWLAEDQELGRRVALKTLAPTADRARFEREAHAAAALSHSNICALYDYGEADDKPFMVLEYLPGGTLEDRLRPGAPLPDGDVQRIATELAAGLAHAHERGLVHRDLKPANVLFDAEGRAKIADFGIARMGDAGTLTEAGTVLGTAAYISPEQAAGLPAAPASDVYSFGVILFRMLTGRLPFVAGNAMELVRMHRDDQPPAVADLRAGAPANLERTADSALAKDPEARPRDGGALLAALKGGVVPAVVPADLAATQVMAAAPARRRRSLFVPSLAGAFVLLGGGAALALALTSGGGSSPPPAMLPSLSVPTAPSAPSMTVPSTAAPSTTVPATTVPTTTASTMSVSATAPATTHRTTTAPATTPATTAPTYVPPTTAYAPPTTTTDTTATTGTAGTTDTTATTTGP